MTKVISISVFLISVIGCAFGNSMALSILLAIVASATFVFDAFLFKKSKIKKCVVTLASIALVALCFVIPPKKQTFGSDNYWDSVGEYVDALSEKENKKADVKYYKGVSCIAEADLEGAKTALSSFTNQTSYKYYLLKENVITLEHQENDEYFIYELENMYKEAVRNNPDWEYALKKAGVFYLDDSEYGEACYYLTKAWTVSGEEDGEAAYYLGVAMFEQGLYEEAFNLFEKAYNAGVSEEMEGYIATYCSFVNGEEETS